MHSERKEMAQDGWLRTIAWLGARGAEERAAGSQPQRQSQPQRNSTAPAPRRQPARRAVNDTPAPPAARIHVLDRPTPRTAAISWSDPGVCHYGYQIWDLGPAKRTGVCVLSGSQIQLGDIVYCPREDEAPLNVGAMIAAAFVDA